LLTSYSDEFAESWGRKAVTEFKYNPLLTAKLGGKTTAKEFEFKAGGALKTAGSCGGITGRGGNLILLDDPTKDWQEAYSPTTKRQLRDWFESTLMTRLEPNGSVILIMTRWAPDDLTGYLLQNDEDGDWTHFNLPALAEAGDLLGREVGQALCPARYSSERLEKVRRSEVGTFKFTAMYQQNPQTIGGSIVQERWLQSYYRELPRLDEVINAWDLTFGGLLDNNSFVSGQAWGRKQANKYLISERHERLTPNEQYKAIENMARATNPNKILIEDAALARGAYDALRNKVPGIILVTPKGSKVERLEAASIHAESGNVYLPDPRHNPWVGGYVKELTASAGEGTLMDRADAFSLAMNHLGKSGRRIRFGSDGAYKRSKDDEQKEKPTQESPTLGRGRIRSHPVEK